jgi:outer membrane protein OmpA-like peptidoglycan-associated protein
VVSVKAHTDGSGDAKTDLKLSDQRASRVVEFIIKQCKLNARRLLVLGVVAEPPGGTEGQTVMGEAENHGVIVEVLARKSP